MPRPGHLIGAYHDVPSQDLSSGRAFSLLLSSISGTRQDADAEKRLNRKPWQRVDVGHDLAKTPRITAE